MCGFLGFATGKKNVSNDWVIDGLRSIYHRGPDDNGVWISNKRNVCLAHTRLSILDLTKQGQQPMTVDSSNITIVFNGEIYNYLEIRKELIQKGYNFNSGSDTEVILNGYLEWGQEILNRLNGMFVFAVYDQNNETLFLARDRAGEKPLFYYHNNKEFIFASELKAIFHNNRISRNISYESLDDYLKFGFVPGENSIIKGFKKLKAGHALIYNINLDEIKTWKYWDLPENSNPNSFDPKNENDLINECHYLLNDSVKKQLIADVPVGVLLSGGLDSSLITAFAVQNQSNIKTFTIGFPGYSNIDETKHARLISNYFKTDHIELMADPASVDLIPILAKQFDEPIADSSMIPTYLVSKLVSQHCKVALGGDGGDELFGGYKHYSRLLWMEKYFDNLPLIIRRNIAKLSQNGLPIGFKGRNWLIGLGTDFKSETAIIGKFFDINYRNNLLKNKYKLSHCTYDFAKENTYQNIYLKNSEDLLQRSTRIDFKNYLTEDILVKVDRSSMLNSLELRAPMLDYRLIDFAFGKLPNSLKATHNNRKIILKKIAKNILPPSFDMTRKQGFSIPIKNWLKQGPFRDLFWSVLTDDSSIFSKEIILSLLKGQDLGRNNGERLFSLLIFELWRNEYKIKF